MDVAPVSLHGLSAPVDQDKHRAPVLLPALVILVGLLLRVGMIGVDARFHPDEALFAAQARLVRHDSLLRDTDLDKPPLTFYMTALSFRLLGPTEFAARLPNVLFSGLSVGVLYALARALYQERSTAALAALLYALAPYDLVFAATAFTDIQATFWILAACLFVARDRWTYAGIACALAFASKSTSVLFVPLILSLGIARHAQTGWHVGHILRRLWRFVWPLVVGIGLLLLWDLARAPRSFFDLGYVRNNPGRLIRSDEIAPRLEAWSHWLNFITAAPLLNVGLCAAGAMWLAYGVFRQRTRAVSLDWLIAGFGLVFLAWFWLVAFNTYDRYIHTLVPFLLLFAARGVTGLWLRVGRQSIQSVFRVVLVAVIVGPILPGTVRTLRGDLPVGGDQGQHTGIDILADTMNMHLRGAIIYDHWLGWELAFYLGEYSQVQIVYMPMPEVLAGDVLTQTTPRYFVVPSLHIATPWIAALERAGIQHRIVYRTPDNPFVIYRLDR